MRDQKGFTLIELLIVVVIIGILAAIAIPKFSSTREKAYFAAMKSDLKNLATQEEIYYSDYYTYTTSTTGARVRSQRGGECRHYVQHLRLGATATHDCSGNWRRVRHLLRRCRGRFASRRKCPRSCRRDRLQHDGQQLLESRPDLSGTALE